MINNLTKNAGILTEAIFLDKLSTSSMSKLLQSDWERGGVKGKQLLAGQKNIIKYLW